MKINILKTITRIFLILVIMNLVSCSVQSKLNRTYTGKNEEFLIENLGKPVTVYRLGKGEKVDVYEKKKRLSKTPINTGRFQYDSFDSPQATKIETFKFLINSSGTIKEVQYECRYER